MLPSPLAPPPGKERGKFLNIDCFMYEWIEIEGDLFQAITLNLQ